MLIASPLAPSALQRTRHDDTAPGDAPPPKRIAVSAPLRELLVWVARAPRTYDVAIAAWRSSCPRLCVWEDALDARLIEVEAPRGASPDAICVRLTPRGQAIVQ